MRNVFPSVLLSSVVSPVIAPSRTDQNLGLPSHPDRSLPLNRLLNPGSTSAASADDPDWMEPIAKRVRPVSAAMPRRRAEHERFMSHLDAFDSVIWGRSGFDLSLQQSTGNRLRIHPRSGRLVSRKGAKTLSLRFR